MTNKTADRPPSDPIVAGFAQRLSKVLRLEKPILFGSWARGDPLITGDYDFIVVSPDFEGKPSIRRGLALYDAWTADEGFEALCHTPQEFERKQRRLCIVQTAVNEGIEIELA